ncbi:hypothetical protein BDW74DRAFT_181790 [Aspergillus multicolor]|uniref:EthD domain-containing protein n=1 Tax=Aspergillus multicolor TaxID=41759 RepID=UPI003CCCE3F6
MVITVLIAVYRKPGVATATFRERYEAHIDLVKQLTGEAFPLAHRRTYIACAAAHSKPTAHPRPPAATGLYRVSPDASTVFGFDVIAEVTFSNWGAYEEFIARTEEPDVALSLCASANTFIDVATMSVAIAGDVVETIRSPGPLTPWWSEHGGRRWLKRGEDERTGEGKGRVVEWAGVYGYGLKIE